MLFGLHRMDSVPKDVWINKIIKEHYAGKFPVERYKGFAGVIQQYIFSYASNKSHSKDG
jgi:N-glycosylase/DNA lyase